MSATQEQRQTQVTSHELAEIFTNPLVGSNEAWSRPSSSPNDPHEVGDICAGQSATITVGPNTWTVQNIYSKYDDTKSNGATICISDSDPLASMLPGSIRHHAYYVGSDNGIHLWYWDGTSWADQTLGGSVLSGTSPSSYNVVELSNFDPEAG